MPKDNEFYILRNEIHLFVEALLHGVGCEEVQLDSSKIFEKCESLSFFRSKGSDDGLDDEANVAYKETLALLRGCYQSMSDGASADVACLLALKNLVIGWGSENARCVYVSAASVLMSIAAHVFDAVAEAKEGDDDEQLPQEVWQAAEDLATISSLIILGIREGKPLSETILRCIPLDVPEQYNRTYAQVMNEQTQLVKEQAQKVVGEVKDFYVWAEAVGVTEDRPARVSAPTIEKAAEQFIKHKIMTPMILVSVQEEGSDDVRKVYVSCEEKTVYLYHAQERVEND